MYWVWAEFWHQPAADPRAEITWNYGSSPSPFTATAGFWDFCDLCTADDTEL